ncbi:MAG: tetratricopeptide repeat protein, partial [Chitinophagaceae bacterium]
MLNRLLKTVFPIFISCLLLAGTTTAQQVPDSLRNRYRSALHDSTRIHYLQLMGEYWENDLPDSALPYFNEAYRISSRIGSSFDQVTNLLNIGTMYVRKEQYDKARTILEQGLALSIEKNYAIRTGSFYNNIGNTYLLQNHPHKAIEHYLLATQYLQSDSGKLATIHANISVLFRDMRQLDKAIGYAEKAIDYARGSRDPLPMYSALTNAGDIYKSARNDSRASSYFATALSLVRTIPDVAQKMVAYSNMADILNTTGHDVEADAFADTALHYARLAKSDRHLAYALNQKGEIKMKQHRFAEARQFFYNAEDPAKRASEWQILRVTYYNLAMSEKATNNLVKAFSYLEKYSALKDSSFNEETARTVGALEARYQSEARQQKIRELEKEKLLQQSNLSRKNIINSLLVIAVLVLVVVLIMGSLIYKQKQLLQVKRISELERERELTATRAIIDGQEEERRRIAKDLHDGMGGMLSGVKYALSQTNPFKDAVHIVAGSLSQSIILLDNSISELRRIAHNLASESLVKYGLSAAINDYCTNINKTGIVNVVFQSVNSDNLPIDTARSNIIYRIVQELLNNTQKHAGATHVIVQLSREGNTVSITVEDDGKGFDITQAASKKGMGWGNIHTRINYLRGQLDV